MNGVERVKVLLHDALEQPRGQRDRFLEAACAGDPALRARLEALIRSHETADEFLGGATGGVGLLRIAGVRPPDARVERGDDGTPVRIGRYRILRQIGTGGFGTVHLAEQDTPVRRRVALKLLHRGVDSRDVVQRFEIERQALALMDHPGIATVLDAGMAEDGRPFVVLEYVDGRPITAFCDEERLDVRRRLQLFEQVCLAVQHAHQKGVIHRDIKPSNVLVTIVDGEPWPKVIDFGIAKAIHGPLSGAAAVTISGQIIGTPQAMPPEQVDGDVDTRADVYGLGVILYELLAGVLPFDPERLGTAPLAELLRIIASEEPPTPAQRLEALGSAGDAIAAARCTDRARLRRALAGDLSWIVMRAIAKDRARRYPTAYALSADIRRALHHEPVEAGPPTGMYRLMRFARRHQGLLTAAMVAALALVAGLIVALAMLVEARQQERVAHASAMEADGVTTFLADLLASADPRAAGRSVPLLEVLESAAPEIDRRFPGSAAAAARLHETVGRAFLGLGRLDEARDHLMRAQAIADTSLAASHPIVPAILLSLAQLHRERGELEEALAVLDRFDALSPASEAPAGIITRPGGTDAVPDAGAHAMPAARQRDARAIRASVLRQDGRFAEAEAIARSLLADRIATAGERSLPAAHMRSFLGGVLLDRGEIDAAATAYAQVHEIRLEALGASHPDTIAAMRNLAEVRLRQRRVEESLALAGDALAAAAAQLGDDHPETMAARNALAAAMLSSQRMPEAAALFRANLESQRRVLGPEHRDTMVTMNNLSILSEMLGDVKTEWTLKQELLRMRERVLGPDHHDTMLSSLLVARMLIPKGDFEDALPLIRRAAAYFRRSVAPDDPRRVDALGLLAQCGRALGLGPEAQEAMAARIEGLREVVAHSDASPRARRTLAADLLDAEPASLRDPVEAARLLATLAAESPGDASLLERLAVARVRSGDPDGARAAADAARAAAPDDAALRARLEALSGDDGDGDPR